MKKLIFWTCLIALVLFVGYLFVGLVLTALQGGHV